MWRDSGGRTESTPRATKTCGVEAYRVLKTSLMIADRWGSPGRTTELAQAVLCWASHRVVGGQVQCASRRACPINIQQQQWCWSYAAGWCLCRHAQNSQTVHSVPSATGSCAEDGDLVAGAIGGARHRTDQWIEPGMRVHYTGSFCARPVKRTAIRDLDQTVSSCPGSSCHIYKKERTTQKVDVGPAWQPFRVVLATPKPVSDAPPA